MLLQKRGPRPQQRGIVQSGSVQGRWSALFVCLLVLLGWSGQADASELERLRREAAALEKDRDCEGAYKKYEELQKLAPTIRNARRRRHFEAFVATKLGRLKACYEKCTPSEQEAEFLKRAKEYEQRGQVRRAYRILAQVLRGKNPRCTSWKEAAELRKQVQARLPRSRIRQKVDPCEVGDQTRSELSQLKKKVQTLRAEIEALQKPPTLPPAPKPPRWARKGKRRRWWLRRWRRRMRWKMRRRAERNLLKRLRKTLSYYRLINQLREKVFALREEFQHCDAIYGSLKSQSKQLKEAQGGAQKVVGQVYEKRISVVKRKMRWFARRYRKARKRLKLNKATMQSLKEAMQRQREFIDELSQDLLSLSTVLVFQLQKKKEGVLLSDSMDRFHNLIQNHQKVLTMVRKRHPEYFKSAGGQKSLRRHIASLERFEKVLEKFQGQQSGKSGEKVQKTLQKVRASILLLEKAEEKAAQSTKLTSSPSKVKKASSSSGTSRGTIIGIVLLLAALLIGGPTLGYVLVQKRRKERQHWE